jgi:N-(2-amino-2-carboxyethyl)-L-glutamate synthase
MSAFRTTIGDIFGVPFEVGNTSLREVNVVVNGRPFTVSLKLEGENPCGSIKDRTALFLIEDAETRGLLTPGGTIVESTSGNLGVAVATLCRLKGYRFLAVVDPKTTAENIARLNAAGAQVDLVEDPDETGGYLLTRLRKVEEICRRNPEFVWLNQYSNPANPRAHFLTTAPEIFWQMRGRVDAIFLPVSTGGTLAGVSRFFRNASPSTLIVAVDAVGSVAVGGQPGPRKLTGIGSSRPAEFVGQGAFDKLILVTDAEAFAFCNALYAVTSIKVGGSSGAALAACAKVLASLGRPLGRVVCLCPDRGENYESTIYNGRWLAENGFTPNYSQSGLPVELRPCA